MRNCLLALTITLLLPACAGVQRDEFDGTVKYLKESQEHLIARIEKQRESIQRLNQDAAEPAEDGEDFSAKQAQLLTQQQGLLDELKDLKLKMAELQGELNELRRRAARLPEPKAGSTVAVPVLDSNQLGPSDAWVTMVMFSDFDCSACRTVNRTVQALLKKYPKDLRVVYKHNPTGDGVPEAAVAAECAGKRGDFWRAHDAMLAHPSKPVAATAGLSSEQLDVCRRDHEIADRIERDRRLANAIGVQGTPYFFVNGEPIKGGRPFSVFDRMVAAARAEASKSGVQRGTYYDQAVLRRGATAAR